MASDKIMSAEAEIERKLGSINSIEKRESYFFIAYETGEQARLQILNNHVFRFYLSPTGEFLEYPKPLNPNDVAKINIKKVEDYEKKAFENSTLEEDEKIYSIGTDKILIKFHKLKGTMEVLDKDTNKEVLKETRTLIHTKNKTVHVLKQRPHEFFFGGGMQNGRFTHKGEVIKIVNTNQWVDGGVTSPNPFYWSTYGYGILRNTWQKGFYDFGAEPTNNIKTVHYESYFDAFYFINPLPVNILRDYYELTGQPIFIPEYAFYEAHLNTFNRDYWVLATKDTPRAVLFEDGHYYKKYQPKDMGDKVGIQESLNGEKFNYQFSARAMIERYKKHDVPLGWFIPNDGYGSGYGQTETLDGDIKNLKEFSEYANKNGVILALWTESNLEPADPSNPKKGERDLNKEVEIANAMALKCDVAWIGSGYSFGLSAVEHASEMFLKSAKNKIRPMIIMVDGWAGTQRHAGIWSGDQSGGEWEYIRFHIPTYIGAGLSGIPLVGSDMDGIYKGGDKMVNIRDFQWKTFTPLQLNMDGWGNCQKTPFYFGNEATAINRAYLKLKSMLMPYNYTIAYESTHGLPMVRAMFLEFPLETSAYTKDSQYQFMWGPNILVAPVYKNETIRNEIYLPNGNDESDTLVWIDLLSGGKYQGGKIYNNIEAPIWKLPVFVKSGSIIPLIPPNNNLFEIKRDQRIFAIYPDGKSSFTVFEDDGVSPDFSNGEFATSEITVEAPKSNENRPLHIHLHKTKGTYKTMTKLKSTLIQIQASGDVEAIKIAINGDNVHITKAYSDEEFDKLETAYYFKEDFLINPYLKDLGGKEISQSFLLIKIKKVDITANEIRIKIKEFNNEMRFQTNAISHVNKNMTPPTEFQAVENDVTSTSIAVQWNPVLNAKYYEIERDSMIFTNIIDTKYLFQYFRFESFHSFKIRSVNDSGVSEWSEEIKVGTKEDPFKNVIKGVKGCCNIPCQPCEEIDKLTETDNSLWHTDWSLPYQANPNTGDVIKLNFDLGDVYEVDKLEYVPRDDKGNGTFLIVRYRFSMDNKEWSTVSEPIIWDSDETRKLIDLKGQTIRFFEIHVLDSVSGFGSGKQVLFYKV